MLRALVAFALGLVSLVAMGAPPTEALEHPTTPIGTNLLVNPGAEAGDASSDGYASVTIPGWVTAGTPTVVTYNTERGFPTPTPTPGPVFPDFGQQFFSLGLANNAVGLADNPQDCGSISQSVALAGHDRAIEARHMELTWSAELATRGHQIDRARLSLLIYDQNGTLLRHVLLAAANATNEHYRLESGSVTLPPGARMARLKLWQSREELQGRSCDSYYDNLSLKLFYLR